MSGKNYRKACYSVAIEVSKPAEEVFSHLLKDVSRFWPEEVEGSCCRLNDEFVFRSGDGHYSKNRVTELVPGKKLVWLVTESLRQTDNFEWTGTKMIFELLPGKKTLLQFTYDGLIPDNESERLEQVCDLVIKKNLYNLIESVTVTIEVDESPDHVFNCIREVPKWWTRDFEGASVGLNDEFIIHHPNEHYSKQKLTELIPGKTMVWLVLESNLSWVRNKDEWTGTKMVFEIATNDGKTQLRFTHEGLVPALECYGRCEQGWNMVIKERLFNFITSNKTIQ